MEIKFEGQVKNVFYDAEKKRTFLACYDMQAAADVNFTIEGEAELQKKDIINGVLMVESRVYKGMNALVVRKYIPQKGENPK